jgi:hypothetical protein
MIPISELLVELLTKFELIESVLLVMLTLLDEILLTFEDTFALVMIMLFALLEIDES